MISVIIVTAKCSTASACNNPSDNIAEIRYFGTFRLLRPKQNKVLYINMEYMDLLPPASFSRARLARPMDNSVFSSWRSSLDGSTNSKRLASADYACSYYAWPHYACLHYGCLHYACLHYTCSHYACLHDAWLRIMPELVLCLSSLCLTSYYCRFSALIWHVELWP